MSARHVDWSALPLGMASDAAIARRVGCRVETVRTWRVRLGIAPAPSAAQRVLAHMRTDPERAWYARELWEQVRPAVDVTGVARALIARGLVERTSVGRYRLVGP